jgi:hypothetical protein
MPVYLDTSGNSVLSVAICDRCSRKFAYTDLMPDPNFPGMRVCKDDLDKFDPWRLPAIQTENIALRFPRPDVSVALVPDAILTENGFTNGNTFLIEGVPPAGGNTGNLNTLSNQSNNLMPLISAVSPDTGNINGGTTVLITGTNFTDVASVMFGAVNGTNVHVMSPFQLTVIAPPSSIAGAVNVSVITAFGSAVRPGSFTYQ